MDKKRHAANWPKRTEQEAAELADAGWFPFEELDADANDEIFVARLAGFAVCYPVTADGGKAQAERTLTAAREHNQRSKR